MNPSAGTAHPADQDMGHLLMPGALLTPDPAPHPESASAPRGNADAQWAEVEWSGEDPLAQVLAAPNPLLEAARPLLRCLTELPSLPAQTVQAAGQTDENLERLHQTLVREMRRFLSLCNRAGFRREHMVAAGYCLCTALDEAVSKISGGKAEHWNELEKEQKGQGNGWAARSLLLLFHNETHGGEKFFLLLGHMVQTPRAHLHVLELLYRILCLGFEGRYALSMDGARRLETIQRKLLTVLMEHSDPVPRELSPHWQGLSGGRLRFMRTVPVWVTASVLALLLTALYMSSKADLVPLTEQTVAQIRQLAAQPPDQPAPTPGWKDELPLELWFSDAEMRRYGLSVDVPGQILRLPGSLTFSNGTDLNPRVRPLLNRIAQRLKETQRPLQILGHTDNTPLRAGSIFRDNQHLSEERARTVAKELEARGIAPQRMTTSGKSDTQPLGSNDTTEGRTLNRRVELVLLPADSETGLSMPQGKGRPAPQQGSRSLP